MAEYFSHDYGARTDPKLLLLQAKMGQEGKGIYWDLIEFIYEQGGYLMKSECEGIAFAIHTDFDKMMRVLNDFDLFNFDDDKYYSDSVLRRIKVRHEISAKASESAKKRWSDAKAMRSHKRGNAKAMQEKESKVKNSKGENSKENKIKKDSDTPSAYPDCMSIYNDWVIERTSLPAKINGAEGNAMKEIIKYLDGLEQVRAGQKSVADVFSFILSNHSRWQPFHQGQIKLVQINSNLINIIDSIKNGKQDRDTEKRKIDKVAELIRAGVQVDFSPKDNG